MLSNSSRGVIRTVLGDAAPESLGHTQCHEHIYLRMGPSYAADQALWMEDTGLSRLELEDYRAAGGCAIVDAQPYGCGRDAVALARLSRESGVKILAVTGFHKKRFWEADSGLGRLRESRLTDHFVGEVEVGMLAPDGGRTDCRAGLIKAALEPDGLSDPVYRRLFAAAAAAALETGAPLMVHTDPGADPLGFADWLEATGLPARQVIFCHLDRTCADPAVHRAVLERGCWSCCDSIHRLKYLSDEEELRLLRWLKEQGCLPRMLLSLDTTRRRLRSYGGEIGLDYILTQYQTSMLWAGFSPEELKRLCIDNPRCALTIGQRKEQVTELCS